MKRVMVLGINLAFSTICSIASSGVAFADAGVLVPEGKQQPDPAIFSLDEMSINIMIDGGMARVPQRDLRAASSELAAFYIFPPKVKKTVGGLFSTHPPLTARIARLQRLEAQLQGTA